MDLYKTSRIIILPIVEKMEGWKDRDKRELDAYP